MRYMVYKGKKQVGWLEDQYTDDVSVFILDVDERVKVSEHHNVFKGWHAVQLYLDWLFGEGKWRLSDGA